MSDNFANFGSDSDWDLGTDNDTDRINSDFFENSSSTLGEENNYNNQGDIMSSGWDTTPQEEWNLNQSNNEQWNLENEVSPENNEQQVNSELQKKVQQLGYKGTGIVIIGVFVVIALFFFVISSIHIKKPSTNNANSNSTELSSADLKLYSIGGQYKLDYTGKLIDGEAKVISKNKYLLNKQVVYELKLALQLDTQQMTVSYLCNYSSFSQVNQGDMLVVKYQIVEDGYISISSISQ